jgi:hypothetical protein
MIEAVNSVLANSPITRVVAEQQSVANSYAANPERVQVVAQAPYISPYVHVDVNFDKAVLQIRDSETGDVVRTIPTEGQMEAYRRAQTAVTPALNRQEPQVQSETSAPTVREATVTAPALRAEVKVSTPVASASSTQIQAATAQVAPSTISIDTQA